MGAKISNLILFLVIQLLILAPDFRRLFGATTEERGIYPMQKYIGIGFVILCFAVLAGIVGILGYQFHLSKEKVDISPANANINHSNKTTDE